MMILTFFWETLIIERKLMFIIKSMQGFEETNFGEIKNFHVKVKTTLKLILEGDVQGVSILFFSSFITRRLNQRLCKVIFIILLYIIILLRLY